MSATRRGIAVKDLFGGRFLAPEVVLQSMGTLEERLDAEFQERTRLNAEIAAQARIAAKPILALANENQGADAVADLRQISARNSGIESCGTPTVRM